MEPQLQQLLEPCRIRILARNLHLRLVHSLAKTKLVPTAQSTIINCNFLLPALQLLQKVGACEAAVLLLAWLVPRACAGRSGNVHSLYPASYPTLYPASYPVACQKLVGHSPRLLRFIRRAEPKLSCPPSSPLPFLPSPPSPSPSPPSPPLPSLSPRPREIRSCAHLATMVSKDLHGSCVTCRPRWSAWSMHSASQTKINDINSCAAKACALSNLM